MSLEVNGRRLEDFVFSKTSYPWAGIQTVIPQDVAEAGPLTVRLVTSGGETPPSHLPQDLGVGVDWIELSPMSGGVLLLPTTREWVSFFILLLGAFLFSGFLSLSPSRSAIVLLALSALASLSQVFYPVTTSKLLSLGWLFFLGCVLLIWIAELMDAIVPTIAGREARPPGEKV